MGGGKPGGGARAPAHAPGGHPAGSAGVRRAHGLFGQPGRGRGPGQRAAGLLVNPVSGAALDLKPETLNLKPKRDPP
eukprot:1194175-Prorocentrum_minimum.AAC.3